jgi:VWFA-related protein
MVAGGIGLPLSEFLFQAVGAGIIGRALGWAIFGMLIGLAEGIVGRNQAWKGMLGGLIGGALGGILLESAGNWLSDPLTGKAAGLVLLGASVGAFISLIAVLLSRAWLEVTSGKLKGTEFILDKFMKAGGPAVAIGSSPLKSEIVLPDPDIAPQHAMLTGDGMTFSLVAMKMICYRLILTLGLLALLLAPSTLAVSAQEETQVRITQVDNSKFPNVTVYVSVTNAAGEPVGVDPATIQIQENGQPMTPVDMRGGGQGQADPLTTMLVIDISGSMEKNGKIAAAKESAKAYVSQMRPGDQAGLITFDTQVYTVQPVTTDTAALIAAIDGLKTGSDTAMYNALTEAGKSLEGVAGRKAIILLSDGMDNQSQNTADDVINTIGPSGLTISAIGFGDASAAGQAGIDETGLKSLTEKAGGLYSYASDQAALTALYQQFGRTLQSEYAITYVSPATLRDGVNRGLTVSLGTGAAAQGQYNPGGVLPEISSRSWSVFGIILGGLLLLLVIPFVIMLSRGSGLFKGGKRQGGKIKMGDTASATSGGSPGRSGKKPRIKIK